MCRVSDKIKFCTCSNLDEVYELKDYWVFHSYSRFKRNYIIGEPMCPVFLDKLDEEHSRKVLLERVNEPDAFDIKLNPKEKDRLEVTFSIKLQDCEAPLTYGFEYKKGRWVECEYDPLEWQWKHDGKTGGECPKSN